MKKIINLPDNIYSAIPSFSGEYMYLIGPNIWVLCIDNQRIIKKILNTRHSYVAVSCSTPRWGYISCKDKTIECVIFQDEKGDEELCHLSLPFKNEVDSRLAFSPDNADECWIQLNSSIIFWCLKHNEEKLIYQTEGYLCSATAFGNKIAFLECFPIPHPGNLLVCDRKGNVLFKYPIYELYDNYSDSDEIRSSWIIALHDQTLILACEHGRPVHTDLFRINISSNMIYHELIRQYPFNLQQPTLSKTGQTILMYATTINKDDFRLIYYIIAIDAISFQYQILQKTEQDAYWWAYIFPDEKKISISGNNQNGVYLL